MADGFCQFIWHIVSLSPFPPFILSGFIHSHPVAIGRQSAVTAVRGDRFAEILAIGDQQAVNIDPVFRREFVPQRKFRVVRRFRRNIPPPVRDAMHMCIHGNRRLSKLTRKHHRGCLAPHPCKCNELFHGLRNLSFKVCHNLFCKQRKIRCFCLFIPIPCSR